MATVLTESLVRSCEFILSEATGNRSRENGIVAMGQVLLAGQVVQGPATALVAASGAMDSNLAAVTAVTGIVMYATDATDADTPVAYFARDGEVKEDKLKYPVETSSGGEKASVIASLKALNIIVRGEFA